MDFCPDGAVHIRESLAKAVQENDGLSVKVQYIGAPRYRLVVRAPDYKTAEEEIEKAANRVIQALTAKGGEAQFHRKDWRMRSGLKKCGARGRSTLRDGR